MLVFNLFLVQPFKSAFKGLLDFPENKMQNKLSENENKEYTLGPWVNKRRELLKLLENQPKLTDPTAGANKNLTR